MKFSFPSRCSLLTQFGGRHLSIAPSVTGSGTVLKSFRLNFLRSKYVRQNSDEKICAASVRAYARSRVFSQTIALLLRGQGRARVFFSPGCTASTEFECILGIVVQRWEQAGEGFCVNFPLTIESNPGGLTPEMGRRVQPFSDVTHFINIYMIVRYVVGAGRRY